MASQSQELLFNATQDYNGQGDADPKRMANRVFAGVCGWIVLCVAGGALLGHKNGPVDPMKPITAVHYAEMANRTSM